MAEQESQEPQGAYGTVHVMEQEMREKGMGAFGGKVKDEVRPETKAEPTPVENKAETAPANKAVAGSSSRKAAAKRKAK